MEKKQIRKTANKVGISLLLYEAIFNIIPIVFVIGYMIVELMASIISNAELLSDEAAADAYFDSLLFDDYWNSIMGSEWLAISMIIAVLLGTGMLLLIFRKTVSLKGMFQAKKKMSTQKFAAFLCLFLGVQFSSTLLDVGFESVLNRFGFTAMESIESATATSTTVSMFLYASLIGPVIEEEIYRGIVLQSFQKYGKMFALIVSSLLFGIMHGNLPQAVFAFGMGMIMGYVAMEYSLGGAILLHIFNNCVFGDLLSYAIGGFSENVQNIIYYVIMILGTMIGVIVLWKKRNAIREYFEKNRSNKKQYLYVFTSIALIAFLILMFYTGLDGIHQL